MENIPVAETRNYVKQFSSEHNSVYNSRNDLYGFTLKYSHLHNTGIISIPDAGGHVDAPKSAEQNRWFLEQKKDLNLTEYYAGFWKFESHNIYKQLVSILEKTHFTGIYYCTSAEFTQTCLQNIFEYSKMDNDEIIFSEKYQKDSETEKLKYLHKIIKNNQIQSIDIHYADHREWSFYGKGDGTQQLRLYPSENTFEEECRESYNLL